MLLAGTNNVGAGATAEDVTRGIQEIVRVMQAKAPSAKIVLTAVFPRNDRMPLVPVIDRVNIDLAKWAEAAKVRFLNVNDKLADKDGKLFEGMTGDRLHPTVKGYQVWADALKPVLTELLGPPAKEDHAPAPTGDPSARR
jgi:lysophospholipase L1-like esterase